MRLTYTDIQNQYLRNIGKSGSTDTTIVSDFQLNMGQRYQMIMAKMANYMTQISKTASTVVNQAFYHYPVGVVSVETATLNLGTYTPTLDVINSQHNWDLLNSIQIQASAVPRFIFPRRDDFGIWPTPQGIYTITFNYHLRDRNLLIADYTTGTVTVTQNSQTLTGAGGATFTPAMVGRWLVISTATAPGEGYWYRISAYVSSTELTLETSWEGSTGSGLTYRIGQTPEIPEEGHILLSDGATADFYAGLRGDTAKASLFDNKFWTGSFSNTSRKEGDTNIKGGLIGLVNLYGDRNNSRIINRRPKLPGLSYQTWGTTLS